MDLDRYEESSDDLSRMGLEEQALIHPEWICCELIILNGDWIDFEWKNVVYTNNPSPAPSIETSSGNNVEKI